MRLGEKVRPAAFRGGTKFKTPSNQGRYLDISDLYQHFGEGTKRDRKGNDVGWTLALMEMLVDPILYTWVPPWVSEQYERANPFFKEVLLAMQSEVFKSNEELLRKTRREMIHRHHLHLRRQKAKVDEKKRDDDTESESEVAH